MSTRVLFMCPHSAGKSLAAATYLRAAAARTGVEVTINVAGTDPDEVNMPTVVSALAAQGFTIGWDPKLVDAAATANADVVISIGCDHDEIPTDEDVVEWDVPMLSDDLMGSLQAIYDLAEGLAQTLSSS